MNSLCSRRSARHLPALSGQQQADGAAFALRRAGHGAEASWLVQGRKARAEHHSSPGEKSDLYPRSYVYTYGSYGKSWVINHQYLGISWEYIYIYT